MHAAWRWGTQGMWGLVAQGILLQERRPSMNQGTVHGRNLHQLGCKKPCKSWHTRHKKTGLPDFRTMNSIIDHHYILLNKDIYEHQHGFLHKAWFLTTSVPYEVGWWGGLLHSHGFNWQPLKKKQNTIGNQPRWWFQVFFIFTPILGGLPTRSEINPERKVRGCFFFSIFFHTTVYHTYDYVLAARDFKRSRNFLSPSLCACIYKYFELCPHEGYENSVSPKCPWPLGQLPVMDIGHYMVVSKGCSFWCAIPLG